MENITNKGLNIVRLTGDEFGPLDRLGEGADGVFGTFGHTSNLAHLGILSKGCASHV